MKEVQHQTSDDVLKYRTLNYIICFKSACLAYIVCKIIIVQNPYFV